MTPKDRPLSVDMDINDRFYGVEKNFELISTVVYLSPKSWYYHTGLPYIWARPNSMSWETKRKLEVNNRPPARYFEKVESSKSIQDLWKPHFLPGDITATIFLVSMSLIWIHKLGIFHHARTFPLVQLFFTCPLQRSIIIYKLHKGGDFVLCALVASPASIWPLFAYFTPGAISYWYFSCVLGLTAPLLRGRPQLYQIRYCTHSGFWEVDPEAGSTSRRASWSFVRCATKPLIKSWMYCTWNVGELPDELSPP